MVAATGVTIGMIVKLKMVDATTPQFQTSHSCSQFTAKSRVAVCVFYGFSQVANFADMVLRGINNDGKYFAAYISVWFLTVNSTINFFKYLATSR